MRCWIGASRLPSASAAELSALMANRSRNEPTAGSVNVACSRCWPRSAFAPPALPRPVSAARSAPDSAYLLTQATAISSPSALLSCPLRSLMSDVLGAISEAITQLPANHAREDFIAATVEERGTGSCGAGCMAGRSEGRVGNPRLPVTMRRSQLRPRRRRARRTNKPSFTGASAHRWRSSLEPPQVGPMCLLGW